MRVALDVNNKLDLALLGPMRGRYVNQQISGKPTDVSGMADPAKTFRQAGSTPTARYLNRSSSSSTARSSLPGPQFVVLNMAASNDQKFLVRYTLQVEVVGKPATS